MLCFVADITSHPNRKIVFMFYFARAFQLSDLTAHLPPGGAYKHGPTYIYRLWRTLLDQWIGVAGADVYVVTPLLDARRLADILLMLVKHKLTRSRVHVYTLHRCDAEHKFSRVYKEARDLLQVRRLTMEKGLPTCLWQNVVK